MLWGLEISCVSIKLRNIIIRMDRKKLIFIIISFVVCLLVYLPTPKRIDPSEYHPGELTNIEALQISKNRLNNAVYISTPAPGSEDVEVDKNGYIYSGLHDGSIIQISSDYSAVKVLAKSEGPIFGISLSHSGDKLAVADQVAGIKILDLTTGQFEYIVSEYNGQKFKSPNGVAFGANDEIIYFSVSSEHIKMSEFHEMLLYSEGSGRIFSYHLKDKRIDLLASGLHFANGVEYSQKDNCLYFVQTSRSRLNKLELQPAKLGNVTVIVDNIFGYPDNVKQTASGDLWVALPALRDAFSNIIDNNVVIRRVLLNLRVPLGMFLALANMKYAGGLRVNPQTGEIVEYFFGDSSKINCISGMTQANGKLFLSSLSQNKIAVVDLPQQEELEVVYPLENQQKLGQKLDKVINIETTSKITNPEAIKQQSKDRVQSSEQAKKNQTQELKQRIEVVKKDIITETQQHKQEVTVQTTEKVEATSTSNQAHAQHNQQTQQAKQTPTGQKQQSGARPTASTTTTKQTTTTGTRTAAGAQGQRPTGTAHGQQAHRQPQQGTAHKTGQPHTGRPQQTGQQNKAKNQQQEL